MYSNTSRRPGPSPGPPSRPSRRIDNRDYPNEETNNDTDGAHYATSAIVSGPTRDLDNGEIRTQHSISRAATMRNRLPPRPPETPSGRRSRSRPANSNRSELVSKVTRSRSMSSRPAGFNVYHRPGHQYQRSLARSQLSSRPPTRNSDSKKSGVKAGVVVETMSAPNPFCPNTRGVCCLLVLINLALILVAIGFIIVLQLHDPPFVWNIGLVVLVFGFFTFLVALAYCVCICQESARARSRYSGRDGELYWTHHWQKNITIPEIRTRDEKVDKWESRDDRRRLQHQVENSQINRDERRKNEDVEAPRGRSRSSSSSSSRNDYPRLQLESDYRTTDFDTDRDERRGRNRHR